MKKSVLFLCFGIFFIIISCSIEDAVDRREDKLIGAWQIHKVIYDKYGGWFKKKVTRDYEYDEFEFLPNQRVIYFDEDIGVEFDGNWEIVPQRQYDHNGDEDYEFYIDMYFYDPVYDEVFGYYGYISRLTRQKFTFHVSDGGGELEFQFQRR